MGIEYKLTPTITQAKSMSDFAGIELNPDQIKHYISLRESSEKEICSLSDQKILNVCLRADQQEQFKERFKNIKF